MEPLTGSLMSGTLGLVCGGLCCILAAALILAAVIGLLRRKKDDSAPAPALDSAPAPAPEPAPAPAPRASPPPLPPSAASLRMDDDNAGVEDFDDEDEAPTTLMVAGSGLPPSAPAKSTPAPSAPAPSAPPASGPPPAPRNAGPPKAARSHDLDASSMPDIPALRPGATIIPPDDWHDDYIEDEDADETMLMPRPKLDLDED
jgi:hypothetical protein